jgi:Type I phosphodiesterase / nucleotide pyrophosphatase
VGDLERFKAWRAEGRLVHPLDQPGTVDLTRAVGALNGIPLDLRPEALELRDRIGDAQHLVFALVDGLGMNALGQLDPSAFLRRHLDRELRAVFPSTTASALTSLATGAWPGQHGIPGWWTHLPEYGLTSTVLPFVERFGGQPLSELGVTPERVFELPALASRYARDARVVIPQVHVGSVYSDYTRGTVEALGAEHLEHAVDTVLERVRRADGPTYTYLYTPVVDTVSHLAGFSSSRVQETVRAVDAALERLADGAPVRLVVSADHGHLETPDERKHLLGPDDRLLGGALAIPPAGEARVPMLFPAQRRVDEAAAAFRERFGERFALLSIDEVEDLRLLGPDPLSPTTRRRVGAFLAVSPGPDVIELALPDGTAPPIRGYHAGLTPAEMRIPLILAGS